MKYLRVESRQAGDHEVIFTVYSGTVSMAERRIHRRDAKRVVATLDRAMIMANLVRHRLEADTCEALSHAIQKTFA